MRPRENNAFGEHAMLPIPNPYEKRTDLITSSSFFYYLYQLVLPEFELFERFNLFNTLKDQTLILLLHNFFFSYLILPP